MGSAFESRVERFKLVMTENNEKKCKRVTLHDKRKRNRVIQIREGNTKSEDCIYEAWVERKTNFI